MSTPRIAPVEAPFEQAVADIFNRIMPPGMEPLKLFRTMARNPRVLQRMFAGGFLDKGSIALRDREIVILRTCARCGSEYEWGVHAALFAARAGLDEDVLKATLDGIPASPRDALLIRLVDALHDRAGVPEELWQSLAGQFSDEQLLELIALTGYYHTISFLTNALRIEPEPYAARFSGAANS